MASPDGRIRRIAAVHALIGMVFELGGRIVDGFGHLDPAEIDVLLDELRTRLKEAELQLFNWEDATLDWLDGWDGGSEDLAS